MPEVIRTTLPFALEGATKGSHTKVMYKRYRFDFYKEGGVTCGSEKVVLKSEKKKSKAIIPYYMLCLGCDVEIELTFVNHVMRRVLKSGDALFVD